MNTTLCCDSVTARSIAQRAGLGKAQSAGGENAMVARGCLRERGCRSIRLLGGENKGDLGTKVLPVARLNTLRGACGIVVPGELANHTVEGETELDPD